MYEIIKTEKTEVEVKITLNKRLKHCKTPMVFTFSKIISVPTVA